MVTVSTALIALVACLLANHASAQTCKPKQMLCPGSGGPGPTGECYNPNDKNCIMFGSAGHVCPGKKSCICVTKKNNNIACLSSATDPCKVGTVYCSPGGGGDPVFTGFDGQDFSFDGIPGQIFNLISEQNHQLNALFTFTELSVHNGTTMSDVGLKAGPHSVVVHVKPDSSLTALVDGKEMNTAILQSSVKLNAPPMNVTYEMFRPAYGHSIEVVTSGMRFLIYSTRPYTDQGGVRVQSYLNFETTLLRVPVNNKIHGVMGQSYYRAHPFASTRSEDPKATGGDDVSLLDITQRSSLLEVSGDDMEHASTSSVLPCNGLVEGADFDYIVSSLTGDDFKYNLFKWAPEKSSRRLMASASDAPASTYMVASFIG